MEIPPEIPHMLRPRLNTIRSHFERNPQRLMASFPRDPWAVGILLGSLAAIAYVAFFADLAGDDLLLYMDEYHSAQGLGSPWQVVATRFYSSGLAFPLLQKGAIEVFGRGLWVYRLPALAGALGTLFIFFVTARVFIGPVSASRSDLERLALAKLNKRLSRT